MIFAVYQRMRAKGKSLAGTSHFVNTILSLVVISWIGLQPPQVEPVLSLCIIDSACIPEYFR